MNLKSYHRQRKLSVAIVRYFNSYGPRLDPRGYGSVVARFIDQALTGKPLTVHGDGEQTRCFTYVDDTVEGTVLAATVDGADGEVLNIARGDETSIRQLAETIRDMTESPSEVICVPYEEEYDEAFEDTRRRVPSVEKAKSVLGFRARVPLADGLLQTIDWFRNVR